MPACCACPPAAQPVNFLQQIANCLRGVFDDLFGGNAGSMLAKQKGVNLLRRRLLVIKKLGVTEKGRCFELSMFCRTWAVDAQSHQPSLNSPH